MDDVLIDASSPAVATARQLRQRLRRARRAHHEGSVADALADVYIVVLVVGLYGWTSVTGVRDYLQSPGAQADAGGRAWVAFAVLVAATGFAWRALRVLGPVVVTPATHTWVVASPIDRGAWLRPRFAALVAGAAAGVGLLAVAVAAAGGAAGRDLLWFSLAGATLGVGGLAASVVAQPTNDPRWARVLGTGLIAVGAAIALATVTADFAGGGSAAPAIPAVATIIPTVIALPAILVLTVRARRALDRIDRASLTAGAQVATTAGASVMMLDPSMLTRLIEDRRWRSVGRVHSRALGPARRWSQRVARPWGLLRCEVRRLARNPGAVMLWFALLLVMYAVAVALPSVAAPAHVILAYVAAGRLAGGLRAISRSPGLRRCLGGSDTTLRLAHLVVPATGALVWFTATWPAVSVEVGWLDAVLALGVVAAVYRAATKRPMRYGGVAMDTPFGMIAVDLLGQVLRGPDVLAILIVVQLLVT